MQKRVRSCDQLLQVAICNQYYQEERTKMLLFSICDMIEIIF